MRSTLLEQRRKTLLHNLPDPGDEVQPRGGVGSLLNVVCNVRRFVLFGRPAVLTIRRGVTAAAATVALLTGGITAAAPAQALDPNVLLDISGTAINITGNAVATLGDAVPKALAG
ncbi:hypothetical protein GCM10010145_61350 [Streptomyces ruber]|uniref:Uncharacterized protein n=2 Tax=Streptomyces TaxID=1883 RepID=A0A918EYS2_9ACTN|nr:hypothetical protein [Streptomyces ruber]GGQ83534.1 hypothetical protein GCM10010145_61350 [Streptomyces ruber]